MSAANVYELNFGNKKKLQSFQRDDYPCGKSRFCVGGLLSPIGEGKRS